MKQHCYSKTAVTIDDKEDPLLQSWVSFRDVVCPQQATASHERIMYYDQR